MKNRDIYQQDPDKITLLNSGVAAMTDAFTKHERRTLRFELEHFVCEGEYQRGLVRILDSYVSNQGKTEQPAAWVSGFFGSGKSHLAKMLRFLWTDYIFPKDGASARGLAQLPPDVRELLTEITTLGKRTAGLQASAGTLGAGAGDSVRLALLGIVFKSVGLPESYPLARFCLWLRKNGIYDRISAAVEDDGSGRDFRSELNDMYVNSRIAKALLDADPNFAADEREALTALRSQFPRPEKDISKEEFINALKDTLAAPSGDMPCTVIILDEVQQYIGEDTSRSYAVQEVVEDCSKNFGDRLLFLGTGQTALSGTPALQRLQGRFTVNVELSDIDVETVTRRVVLAKRPDCVNDIKATLEGNAGELDRHLVGTRIGPRSEDRSVLVDDYPLLPVRRRFWEHTLRAVDRAGTAGQLRTQLRMVYDAIRLTANEPLGTVVPADFLFEEQSANLLQSGVLLREVHETIISLDDNAINGNGKLKSRICALVFLIRKLPREGGVDIGIRATAESLADLLVKDLASDGTSLRGKLPNLLDELCAAGTLMKLDDGEYSLQTRESSEWEMEFRTRETSLTNDPTKISSVRVQLLSAAVRASIGSVKLLHGKCKEPRKLLLHFGAETPPGTNHEISVWIRDGWSVEERSVIADAGRGGSDSPLIYVFVPRSQADALARMIATESAAKGVLGFKSVPTAPEGVEARQGMKTRLTEADNKLRGLIDDVVEGAKVYQGGGNERLEATFPEKINEAAKASLDRLFHDFRSADDHRWPKVIERARKGAETPLEVLSHKGKTEDHPVCSAVLSFVSSGKKGKDIRTHFSGPPYGWPRDAIDAALISLSSNGHLHATTGGMPLKPGQLAQAKIPVTDFRVESATINTRQRLKVRMLFTSAGVSCKPNAETEVAEKFLRELSNWAECAGGDAPLPKRPDTRHLQGLQSSAGNEQLLAIFNLHDKLRQNIDDWKEACDLAEERLPAYEQLQSLMCHAANLEVTGTIQPQIEALVENRSLLDATDPVPDLARALTDAMRESLAQAEMHYIKVFDEESERTESAESWQKIDQSARERILRDLNIVRVTKGPTGTGQEVLESLQSISLEAWRTRAAALPQLFAEARMQAAKLVEPKTHHVKLNSATLCTPEEVKAWVTKTEQELLEQLKQGPIVVS